MILTFKQFLIFSFVLFDVRFLKFVFFFILLLKIHVFMILDTLYYEKTPKVNDFPRLYTFYQY